MKEKSLFINLLLTIVIITLVIAAILLIIDRTSAKCFSDIVPNNELFESCQVICADGDKILTDNELDDLLNQLEQIQYYKSGAYGNVMEGNVYIAFFASQQTDRVEVLISDAGKIYINSNCYEFASGVKPNQLSSYLDALLAAQ